MLKFSKGGQARVASSLDPKVQLNRQGVNVGRDLDAWKTAAAGRTTAPIAVIATDGANPVITRDSDGDVNVQILDINPNHAELYADQHGFAAPYEAATHGRDYWLAPGSAHCADCHVAPFVESEGGLAFPINHPGKYSLMRYSKGHAGLSCQACHQSIHGLYPVTPDVDQTTYNQAEALNPNSSHGALKCGTCHGDVNANGVPTGFQDLQYKEGTIG